MYYIIVYRQKNTCIKRKYTLTETVKGENNLPHRHSKVLLTRKREAVEVNVFASNGQSSLTREYVMQRLLVNGVVHSQWEVDNDAAFSVNRVLLLNKY